MSESHDHSSVIFFCMTLFAFSPDNVATIVCPLSVCAEVHLTDSNSDFSMLVTFVHFVVRNNPIQFG